MRLILFAISTLLMVSGCASVSTTRVGPGASTSQGTSYHLARGQLRLKVTDTDGTLSVLVEGPEVTSDPYALMYSNAPASGTSDNHVTIDLDRKTNLLSKVEVTSVGRLTDIVKDLTKAMVMLQGSESTTSIPVINKLYDISDLPAAAAEANQRLEAYFRGKCRGVASSSLPYSAELKKAGYKEDDSVAIQAMLLRCRGLVLAGAPNATAQGGLIKIDVENAAAAIPLRDVASTPGIDFSKCARGICYRPYTSITVTLSVRGAFQTSTAFLLPDPNALAFIDLTQGVFATQRYTLEFGDGVPTRFDKDAKSELVGLAKLPVEIFTTILSAPGEALGLRKKALEDQNSYLDVVKASAAKQDEVAAVCAQKPENCPKTAYKILGGQVNPQNEQRSSDRADPGDTNAGGGEANSGGTDDVPGDDTER